MKIEDVKKNLGREVSFRGTDGYILSACIIRTDRDNSRFFYQVELTDTRTNNSIIIARLEEVNKK
ncbi:MAG: hypothetical protein IJ645_00175 [Ruminococcus sp.]|nr:hypothetical protein [Ruminococcus sp.]